MPNKGSGVMGIAMGWWESPCSDLQAVRWSSKYRDSGTYPWWDFCFVRFGWDGWSGILLESLETGYLEEISLGVIQSMLDVVGWSVCLLVCLFFDFLGIFLICMMVQLLQNIELISVRIAMRRFYGFWLNKNHLLKGPRHLVSRLR